MLANEWSTNNELHTTDSILAQALPSALAVPQGWRSEVLDSSSPFPSDLSTDVYNTNSSTLERHEEYKTLSTNDAPPIIFSSSNEVNRLINEIPSATVNGSEYNSTFMDESLIQEQKTARTKEKQSLIADSLDQQQQTPIVVRKTLPNNTVTYQQNVSVRYLQPPTPPPPGPIIIREVRPPPPAPPSPVQIRQRPPPPETPPPIVIREKPPNPPPRLPSQVVEKCLPPPPRAPRRMIVERFAPCPPKPPDVVVERWLPYKRTDRRRILYERSPSYPMPLREPNLLILHDQPHARIQKEFINQGVSRVDPITYLQRYGSEIDSWHGNSRYGYLIDEASRALPPPHSLAATGDYYGSYSSRYPSSPALISNVWNRMRSASPPPYSSSYHNDASYRYSAASPPPYSSPYHNDASYRYSAASPLPYSSSYYNDASYGYSAASPPPYSSSYYNDTSYRHSAVSPYHYDNYAGYGGNTRTMVDVTPSWGINCSSRLPSYQFTPPYYPPRTGQVNFDRDLDYDLSGLTRDRVVSASANFY